MTSDESPDAQRNLAIANLFLDFMTAIDPDHPEAQVPEGIMDPLIADLKALDAVLWDVDSDGLNVNIAYDLTPLISATLMLLVVLVGDVGERESVSQLTVISAVREKLAELYPI